MAKKSYFSALRQNPLNIKALIRLIQSLLPAIRGNPDNRPKPWITIE